MNTREFLSKVKNILNAYEDAYDMPTYSSECETLSDLIFELSSDIFHLSPEEVERLNNSLTKKIAEVNKSEVRTLRLLQKAHGYLQFYSHCPIDYLYSTSGNDSKKDEIFNKSDWKNLIEISGIEDSQQKFLSQILMQKELKFAYDKVLKETNSGFLCLDAYNHGSLTSALMSPSSLRLQICGPLNENENRRITFTEPYKIKAGDGQYTIEHYQQFIDNNKKTIALYNSMIEMFQKIKEQNSFSGFFYNYSKDELVKFADQEIAILTKNIETIKSNLSKLETRIKNDEFNK